MAIALRRPERSLPSAHAGRVFLDAGRCQSVLGRDGEHIVSVAGRIRQTSAIGKPQPRRKP